MKMSELKYQSQIIDDAKAFNKHTFGIKMNNRFLSGIPDLMIKVPKYSVIFIEAKSALLNSKRTININTTADGKGGIQGRSVGSRGPRRPPSDDSMQVGRNGRVV